MTDQTTNLQFETKAPREAVSDRLLALWVELQRRQIGGIDAAKELEALAARLRGR